MLRPALIPNIEATENIRMFHYLARLLQLLMT